jgi:excisionase family DNA binding protein
MAQGYYTVAEAAQLLGMSEDDLKMIARRGEIRSFQDRGTWRFRVQDIQELARQRGLGSEPDIPLADTLLGAAGSGPKPKSKIPPAAAEGKVFRFAEDDSDENEAIDIGREQLPTGQSGKSSSKVGLGQSPTPQPGSDSDVRLVDDSGFELSFDLEGKGGASAPAMSGSDHGEPKSADSDAKLVNMDSDSDVRITGADVSEDVPYQRKPVSQRSDSEVRLDFEDLSLSDEGESMLTEEINLDEEMQQKLKESAPEKKKVRPSSPELPTTSPFELTQTNLKLPETSMKPSQKEEKTSQKEEKKETDTSSDFELTPQAESDSLPEIGSSEFQLEAADSDDSLDLGEMPRKTELKGASSGINLGNPTDSGISLEQDSEGSDEFDFTLSVEDEKDEEAEEGSESSSEFELTLSADDSSSEEMSSFEESSSEFELTLETDESSSEESQADSSSEFELTIDADDAGAPDLTSDSEFELTIDDETDSSSEFELTIDDDTGFEQGEVQLEDDSGSQEFEIAVEDGSESEVALLDDSSEFDISLEGDDIVVDDESSSQVVTLEEEEVDDAASTVSAKHGGAVVLEEDEPGFGDLAGGIGEAPEGYAADREGGYGEPRVVVKEIGVAPWGPLPVVVMLPCVVVMFIVALMGFELVQSMNGSTQPGMFTKTVSGMIGQPIGK